MIARSRTHANRDQNDASEELAIERKNDGRHAFERLFANAVADAEKNLHEDCTAVDHPLCRSLYADSEEERNDYYLPVFRLDWVKDRPCEKKSV